MITGTSQADCAIRIALSVTAADSSHHRRWCR
jgi:hypothetical protein